MGFVSLIPLVLEVGKALLFPSALPFPFINKVNEPEIASVLLPGFFFFFFFSDRESTLNMHLLNG